MFEKKITLSPIRSCDKLSNANREDPLDEIFVVADRKTNLYKPVGTSHIAINSEKDSKLNNVR